MAEDFGLEVFAELASLAVEGYIESLSVKVAPWPYQILITIINDTDLNLHRTTMTDSSYMQSAEVLPPRSYTLFGARTSETINFEGVIGYGDADGQSKGEILRIFYKRNPPNSNELNNQIWVYPEKNWQQQYNSFLSGKEEGRTQHYICAICMSCSFFSE